MNDHEAQRIAAAIHAARPDWPAGSILTLIRTKLAARPRRDVFVALAWVAADPASKTPARVMETGPWWRAAGVEGTPGRRDRPEPHERCSVTALPIERCSQVFGDDGHDCTPDFKPEVAAVDVSATVDGLKAMTKPEPEPLLGPGDHSKEPTEPTRLEESA